MSDINLLPTDQREKEHKEEKQKASAKSEVNIELTSPEKKEKPQIRKPDLEVSGLFKQTKNKINKIFSKKSKPPTPPKTPTPPQPEIPKHLDSVNNKEPEKKFYYQPNNQKKPEDKKDKRTEDKEDVHPVKPLPEAENSAKAELFHRVKPITPITPISPKPQAPKSPTPPQPELHKPLEDIGQNRKTDAIKPDKSKLDINLIPSKIKTVITFKQQLVILIVVIMVCVLISAGTYFGIYQAVASRQTEVERIESENQKLIQKLNNLKETNQEVVTFIDLLKQTKELTQEHIFITHVFEFLEVNTLKQVYYSDFQFKADDLIITLTANTNDYQTLAQQIFWFQSLTDDISQIEVLEAELKEEEGEEGEEKKELVIANLILKFKSEFLNK